MPPTNPIRSFKKSTPIFSTVFLIVDDCSVPSSSSFIFTGGLPLSRSLSPGVRREPQIPTPHIQCSVIVTADTFAEQDLILTLVARRFVAWESFLRNWKILTKIQGNPMTSNQDVNLRETGVGVRSTELEAELP